jgi:protein-tyrosine-phosphatase
MSWPDAAALRILIVSSTNRFRSPLAEHLMRKEWGDCEIAVTSAGIYAEEGGRMHEAAMFMASAHGIPGLGAHRTRLLTQQRMSHADLILTMDEHQQRQVLRIAPEDAGRVLLLGCWRGVEIGDPVLAQQTSLEWTFGLLQSCICDWKQRLTTTSALRSRAPVGPRLRYMH